MQPSAYQIDVASCGPATLLSQLAEWFLSMALHQTLMWACAVGIKFIGSSIWFVVCIMLLLNGDFMYMLLGGFAAYVQ